MISYFLNDTVDMLQFMMFNLSILHDFLQVIFLRICAGRGAEGRKSERTGCVMKILKECLDLLEFCWNCGYTMYLPKFQTLPKGQKTPVSSDTGIFCGAASGNRTRTLFLARDFKSLVSTSSTMAAISSPIIIPNRAVVCQWDRKRTGMQTGENQPSLLCALASKRSFATIARWWVPSPIRPASS